jgi:hypothetical protein
LCLHIPQFEFGERKEIPQLKNGRFRQQKDVSPVHFDSNNCMLITFENLVGLAKTDCDQMALAGNNLGVTFKLPALQKLFNTKEEALLNFYLSIQIFILKKIK